LLGAIALSFVVNMAFVIVSRTALVTMPVMLAVFALLHLKWRANVILIGVAIVLAGLAFAASPQLRAKIGTFRRTINCTMSRTCRHRSACGWNSGKNRCGSFPRRRFSAMVPDRRAGCSSRPPPARFSPAARWVGNPHNQTLNVAIQWGALGIVVLYAMWLVHLRLFRGDGLVSWIGLMVVVQNFFTSLFNSHIFDFTPGWIYVLGVGVAGGMMFRAGSREASSERWNSARP